MAEERKDSNFALKAKQFRADTAMVFKFALNDLKKRYSGSIAGFIWAYVTPLVSILAFWFVFQVGFKNPPVNDMPFILWLVPSYIAWTYISDSVSQSSNVLYEYAFLVKKVKFNVMILPPIKVVGAFIVHSFFIIFTYVLFLIYRFPIHISWLQVLYYTFANTVFLIGVSYIVSALSVFWKDMIQVVNVILQVAFWLCPIFWNPDSMQELPVFFLKLNPSFYIVQGYRECFVGNVPFYVHGRETLYFWAVSLTMILIGTTLYKSLSKHYSDLL